MIYLINLERDTARMSAMGAQLDALGLEFKRISAVDGATLCPNRARLLTPGEVGCYASHLIAMGLVAARGAPAVVLEDDLEIAPDLPQILRALDRLPRGWDFLKLSRIGEQRSFPIGEISPGRRIVDYSRVPWGSGAYVITPAGARKFIDWKNVRTEPIDRDIRHTWKSGLRVYGIEPAPVAQNIGLSSIGAVPAGRIFERHDTPREAIARLTRDLAWWSRCFRARLAPPTPPYATMTPGE